jgi:hypothetical protein
MMTDYDHTKPTTWAARVKARSETFPPTIPLLMAVVTDPTIWTLVEEFVRMSKWERANSLYALAPMGEGWVKEAAKQEALKAREYESRVEGDWKNMKPWTLFHHLWGKATTAANYCKAQWQELEKVIPTPKETA